ncbi:MAG: hypothetical protein ACOYKC_09805 [Anaerolineaceae bacterium]
MTDRELKKVLNKLMGKDVMSWRLLEDGYLVVINKQGWKVTFSAEEVQRTLQELQDPNGKQNAAVK